MESFFGQRRKPYHLFSTLWEVREFGVNTALYLWGIHENFYQTDTVPPSGWCQRRRRRLGQSEAFRY